MRSASIHLSEILRKLPRKPAVRTLAAALLATALVLPLSQPVQALTSEMEKAGRIDPDTPVLLEATQIDYDSANAIVIARGNVEVVQGGRVVFADMITYNQRTNIVKAKGNVSIREPGGEVYFAENVELKEDLGAGVVKNFRARLKDNSLFAAAEARRLSPQKTELSRAVYSPCKICKDEDGDTKPPLWQLKARRVVYDEEAEKISYNHTFLEVYGVPILYTPYFAHPAPGAKRKSGFLTPKYGHSSNLGVRVEAPYYYNISPQADATVTPIYTSQEGMVMAGEFRQLVRKGGYEISGSITNPSQRDALGNEISGREMRGHIEGKGQFSLNPVWGWGFDFKRASDDTYLRRYGFGDEDTLTSRLFLEGVKDASYATVEALSFQGLRIDDDPETTPFLTPYAEAYYQSDPFFAGTRLQIGATAMALSRDEGTRSRRVAMETALVQPYVTEGGHSFTASLSLRSDLYQSEDYFFLNEAGLLQSDSGVQNRLLPEASLEWRYPLIRYFDDSSLIIEPVAAVIASPKENDIAEIPNEDSQLSEFSDSNVFLDNRFAGWDRVETGPRAYYGFRTQWALASGFSFNTLLGQNYVLDNESFYPSTNNLDDHFSDYVGRLALTHEQLQLAYRFRIDRDDFRTRRNEITLAYGFEPLSLQLDYIALDDDPYLGDREEIWGGAQLFLTDNWSLLTSARRDLTDEGGFIFAAGGFLYQNECFSLLTNVTREFTRDRDIEPSTSVTMRVGLKNIN
jgi:LPS-assembly protein